MSFKEFRMQIDWKIWTRNISLSYETICSGIWYWPLWELLSGTKRSLFAWQMQTKACRIQTKMVHLYGCELRTKTETKYHNLAQLPSQVSETTVSWDNLKLANIDVFDGWEAGCWNTTLGKWDSSIDKVRPLYCILAYLTGLHIKTDNREENPGWTWIFRSLWSFWMDAKEV